MGSFVPSTPAQQSDMLKTVGVSSFEELYAAVPESLLLKREELHIADGVSEQEAAAALSEMAGKNKIYRAVFRGAGAYHHYIPAIVRRVVSKEEFLTAYTPYQAEISQGVLQSIFEYQSLICALTGMAVSNASVYDGATAAAEGVAMCRGRGRTSALISGAVWPETLKTVGTYCWGHDAGLLTVPVKDGRTDLEALKTMLGKEISCFCFQQPNRFGVLEDAETLLAAAHEAGVKVIMSVNPISLGLLKAPGELGADIAVGEGQPLGLPLSFGGPYLGFMAASEALFRRLPGRIVGQTADNRGNRCYVLTLQAREQHIRRERAASNICSNQALCALTAAVYLSAMGPDGMRQAAQLCFDKAHALADALEKAGCPLAYEAPFFHEFVTRTPVPAQKLLSALDDRGILGGLPVEDGILWCCTELNTRAQIDEVASVVKEVSA